MTGFWSICNCEKQQCLEVDGVWSCSKSQFSPSGAVYIKVASYQDNWGWMRAHLTSVWYSRLAENSLFHNTFYWWPFATQKENPVYASRAFFQTWLSRYYCQQMKPMSFSFAKQVKNKPVNKHCVWLLAIITLGKELQFSHYQFPSP
jgi:hypothetical protein